MTSERQLVNPRAKKARSFISPSLLTLLYARRWMILLITLLTSLVAVILTLIAKPVAVTITTVLIVGILVGLVLGTLVSLWHEWLDGLLISSDKLQNKTGYQVLGVIPEIKKQEFSVISTTLTASADIAEAYKIATANLHYAQLSDPQKIILVTSVCPTEGKSIAACNLARYIAEMGSKVLLLDADLRMSSIHLKMGLKNNKGLINYLMKQSELDEVTQTVKSIKGLYVITAGAMLKYSIINLLSHKRMASFLSSASKHFDYVIIDSPPVTGFADTLLLHGMASGTLLVVQEKKADLIKIHAAINQLKRIKPSIIGLLKVRAKKDIVSSEYYRKYNKDVFQHKGLKVRKKLNLGK